MSGSLLADAKLMELSPLHVDAGERIGFLHQDKAAALGRLMAVDGQRDPIKVVANRKNADQPWKLVTGMHRLVGARIECLTVFAIEVSGKPEDLADLEASENLHRRPLGPIERAKFTAALVKAAQERIARDHGGLKQHQLASKARWDRVKTGETTTDQALKDETEDACGKMQHVYGWEESVGEALGMERSAIYRDLRISRLIVEPFPDMIEQLSKHPVVGENASQLKAIAQVREESQRRQVIELLLQDPELSADEARIHVGLPDPKGAKEASPEMVLVNRAIGTLARMKDGEREAFVEDQVLKQRVPVMRRIYQRLKEELGE